MTKYSTLHSAKKHRTPPQAVPIFPPLSGLIKRILVWALAILWGWSPTLAIPLSTLVTWCWPGMRRA
jgi:hypothetical protein